MGDGTLLARCAQAWRDAGHAIAFVATRSDGIAQWAQTNGVAQRQFKPDEAIELPPELGFDYLFSVANLEVLPAALIGRARKLAINFHDGPLPRYAGLNAPAWALLNGEARHGITWHEMTARVDAGRIARQLMFDVAPDETALSLNARCYEAGLAAFVEIAADLARGDLALNAQAGERTYFGRDRRPDAWATIDFTRPAQEIVALVRALDFGNYANPLARAKVLCENRVALVREARVAPGRSGAPAGTVTASLAGIATIATGDGDVVLALDAPLQPGARLELLPPELRAQLNDAAPAVARGERYWARALRTIAPVELPYPRERSETLERAQLHGTVSIEAVATWLAAVTSQERVSVLVPTPVPHGLDRWLQPLAPLTVHIDPSRKASELKEQIAAGFARVRDAGPCCRDLATRLGDAHPPIDQLKIAFGEFAELPPGVDLLVTPKEIVGKGWSHTTLQRIAAHLSHWQSAIEGADAPLKDLPLVPPDEATGPAQTIDFETTACVHDAIAQQAQRTPDRIAIEFFSIKLTYRELDERATALARSLVAEGVKPGDIVGLNLARSPSLVVTQLAILKAGAAYLPLDPDYPRDRIAFMVEDSATRLVIDAPRFAELVALNADAALPAGDPSRAAYVIYTSGSTGKPKGVIVTHRNVMNFFAGMDERIAGDQPGKWLAVTSLSFDISVLELCWTLARGFTVVLHANDAMQAAKAPEFSLFYFASDHASTASDRYRLLMEGAKFADRNGFAAVWTPERHFHAFGGLYPNPAVTSAAIAACTSRVQIRAGSCVLPLHHPIRVAEEWAFVDNISQGRVGISFASGWQPNDFVIAPQAFANRKNEMLANIDVVRRLWRGERLPFPGPNGNSVEVQTLPRPVQAELPVWVTAAGNPETFEQAGTLGCNLLTHLLGQNVEDVADKLKLYRTAWHKAGHAGQPHVTLMLHTFVGDDDDAVRETVRKPMKDYLRSSIDLIRQAAWSFPTFVQRAAQDSKSPVEIMEQAPLSEEEMDALLEHAFNRYYGASALFGTKERCLATVAKLRDAGVDEIACLVDFGVPTQLVLDHLEHLKGLMEATRELRPAAQRVSVAEQVLAHQATHLQCTPSMASMLVADAPGRAALSRLKSLMVGGEALPLMLAKELRALVPGQLLNMYGPTETTIWSTTCELREVGDFVPLGTPIANTQLRVTSAWGFDCPALVPGELLIGGEGVTPGYLNRLALTLERFITDASGARWYRTGDLVRRQANGEIEFLGRIDHQVKIRGHRIELGEIESVLAQQPGVKDAIAIARDNRLLAYVTARAGATLDAEHLRTALASELPEVMVPQSVLVLAQMPLTPNGKVDRQALATPAHAGVAEDRAPTIPAFTGMTTIEKSVAAIWQDVLGLQQVRTTDNFFDLGGHSLLVVQVQRRLREACGREVSITDMFRLPTIKALAAHLGGTATQATAVNDGLARAQRRLERGRRTWTA